MMGKSQKYFLYLIYNRIICLIIMDLNLVQFYLTINFLTSYSEKYELLHFSQENFCPQRNITTQIQMLIATQIIVTSMWQITPSLAPCSCSRENTTYT